MPMREMATMGEVQSENGVPRLNDRGVSGHIGGRTGVRLHVGVLGAKELLGAVACQVLDYVGEFASAVVAFAGIAFGVLVGEDGASRLQHGLAHKIFRGDQLQTFMLTALFVLNRLRDLWINFSQRAFHWFCFHDYVLPSCQGQGLRDLAQFHSAFRFGRAGLQSMCEKSFSRQILTQALIPLTIWKPLGCRADLSENQSPHRPQAVTSISCFIFSAWKCVISASIMGWMRPSMNSGNWCAVKPMR